MLPAKSYCFTVAKTNAAISLERVQIEHLPCLQVARVGSVGAVFTPESLTEPCQVVGSVNSAM